MHFVKVLLKLNFSQVDNNIYNNFAQVYIKYKTIHHLK